MGVLEKKGHNISDNLEFESKFLQSCFNGEGKENFNSPTLIAVVTQLPKKQLYSLWTKMNKDAVKCCHSQVYNMEVKLILAAVGSCFTLSHL